MDGGGQLVGVSLNTLLTRPPANDEDGAGVEAVIDDAIYKSHEKFYKIIQISTYAFDRVDLFGRYTLLDTILQAEVWSVAPSHRGRGIAQKMTKAVIEEVNQNENESRKEESGKVIVFVRNEDSSSVFCKQYSQWQDKIR